MEFRVLGSLEASAGGVTVELGPPKQRALLAVLLLHPGELLSTDRLIDLLWGDAAPRTAPHSIQIYISELRRALGQLAMADVLRTRQPGYMLDVAPDSIDAWRFEQLIRAGVRAREEGDSESARERLHDALALWRGPALAEFEYEEFAQTHIRRLHDLHLDAIETLAAVELDAGRHADVVPLVEVAIREDPLRERSRKLYMLALYRSGRAADALRTFDAFRTALDEELGVDPSPAIRGLYDRIVLHDPALLPQAEAGLVAETRNPYKGLRAFEEEDAGDFFGRTDLVERLVAMIGGRTRLISLVGPSGAGKSSVVAAGLLPRLRAGRVDGEQWHVVRAPPDASGLEEVLRVHASGAGSEHLLVTIDQLEQGFTTDDQTASDKLLHVILELARAPDGPIVVVSLRADFYDRPLLHAAFSELFTAGVINVVPMAAREIEEAVVRPAEGVGIRVEPALLAQLVADTANRPGSLPLLQFTLTELFDRRRGPILALESYQALGGLSGLVSRQAERGYAELGHEEQHAAMQVFLRLVQPGVGGPDARRRLTVAALSDLRIPGTVLSRVLTTFGRGRFLTFDRDATSGAATVEIAHEALLSEWTRLADWIERHRALLRRHEVLTRAADEWELASRSPDYLLAGSRLDEFEPWLSDGPLDLTGRERAFLEASRERRRAMVAADEARDEAERRSRRRGRLLLGLSVAGAAVAGVLAYLVVTGPSPPATVALFREGSMVVSGVVEDGFDRGVSDLGLVPVKAGRTGGHPDGATDALRGISAQDPALVIVFGRADLERLATDYPMVHYLVFDSRLSAPNVSWVEFRVWEGTYLAGAAAAMQTETGIIGFIGGSDGPVAWGFQAGFEAGAKSVDPEVTVLTEYLSSGASDDSGYLDAPRARAAAAAMYREPGADVIFNAAGDAGLGIFEAAEELSTRDRQLWVIGVDTDQYETVVRLPGATNAEAWRQHILTSVLKRFDTVVYDALAQVAAGTFRSGPRIEGLASGGVDLTYSGGFIDRFRPHLEALRAAIASGALRVPCIPGDRVEQADAIAKQIGLTARDVADEMGCAIGATSSE